MFGGINPRHAPAPWLPHAFLLSGPLALVPAAIAVTHLLVLGAVVGTMMGALYQLAPVVFVARAARTTPVIGD